MYSLLYVSLLSLSLPSTRYGIEQKMKDFLFHIQHLSSNLHRTLLHTHVPKVTNQGKIKIELRIVYMFPLLL